MHFKLVPWGQKGVYAMTYLAVISGKIINLFNNIIIYKEH